MRRIALVLGVLLMLGGLLGMMFSLSALGVDAGNNGNHIQSQTNGHMQMHGEMTTKESSNPMQMSMPGSMGKGMMESCMGMMMGSMNNMMDEMGE